MDENSKDSNNNKKVNKIIEETNENKYISIEDIDYNDKKIKITSPRSLKAMNNLGIKNSDLEYLTFEEYLNKHPELIADDKKMRKYKYDQIEIIRKNTIDQVREARRQIIEDDLYKNKRCLSSKVRTNIHLSQDDINNNNNNINDIKNQLFVDKDIKAFKRMKNINKTNLFNRIEMELKKVLDKLINDEKDKKTKEIEDKNMKKKEWRMKTENKKKMIEEEERIKIAKEIDKKKRKEEEKRIEYLIQEEEEEKIKIQKIKIDEINHKKEEQKKQEEYTKNLLELRKLRHEKILEDSRQKELRLAKNLLIILKEKKQKRLNSEKNYRNKRLIIEENLKKLDEENEIRNKLILYKQKKQEIKKLQEEQRHNKEIRLLKKNMFKSNQNLQNFYGKTQKDFPSFSQLDDYYNQILTIQKQKSLNDLNKQPFLSEKEKKQKQTLLKNELILNKKKKDIMDKIHEKEKNIERTQNEKNYLNYLGKKDQVKRQLEKEHRVKLITQYLENKRDKLREELHKKDKRVEKFMRNKVNKMRKKKSIYDEITKEKQQDNEQFEKVLNKKSFDKKSLNLLNDIFPQNEKMNKIINEFNYHFDNKDNNKNIRYHFQYDEQNSE